MKTAITCFQDSLDASVDTRFGRCQNFLILDDSGQLQKTIPNPATQAPRGAGVQAAQTITDEKVNVLITGNIGPNAFNLLKQSGVQVYLTPAGVSAKKALDKYQSGELKKAEEATGPPQRGGGGRGRGPGNAHGQGRDRGRNN